MADTPCAAVIAAIQGALLDFAKEPRYALWSQDTLVVNTAVMLAVSLLCWLLSLATRTYSHVDRLWSLLPILYVLVFAREQIGALLLGVTVPAPRLLVMAALVLMWGVRLTWNFARKGGYDFAAEDHRWEYVKRLPVISHPVAWQVFNLGFIALFQNILLLGITLPAYLAVTLGAHQRIGPIDLAAAALFTLFLCGETTADQQQWGFQTEKQRRREAGEKLTGDHARGFVTRGLWRYSRHPNFFCEQGMWWSFYLFGVAASGCWLNITLAGPVALTLLFHGSCWLTERISAGKYSGYRQYQATTSRMIPWLPGLKDD